MLYRVRSTASRRGAEVGSGELEQEIAPSVVAPLAARRRDESAMVSDGDGECGGGLAGGVGQCARNILNCDGMVGPEVQE